MTNRALIVLLAIVWLLGGCTPTLEMPTQMPREDYACMQHYKPDGPPLVRASGEPAAKSSYLTINTSKVALDWRLAMVDTARKQLDFQYFLWRTDDTGTLLINRVLQAADRGVKVRILMDDLDSVAWNDRAIALSTHSNIEVRVFNPFKDYRGGWAGRGIELLRDLDRMNHRMHNKLILVDNKIGMVGGRNIGNEYFGAGDPLDYRDYDVITIGPVVEELSDSFDIFWNSTWAYAIQDLIKDRTSPIPLEDLRSQLQRDIENSELLKREYSLEPQDWSEKIKLAKSNMTTGQSRAVFDCPQLGEGRFPVQVAYTLQSVVAQTKEEILIVSPYVVPLETLRNSMREVVGQGIKVKLLTNSLAATDHTYAFSGYSNHREELLEIGINLYELKPDAAIWPLHRTDSSVAKYVSMHAKMIVFDRRWVFVGSLNLDPRSGHWNTEMGLLIDSKPLANEILSDFAKDMKADSSWRVERRPVEQEDEWGGKDGRYKLYWLSDEGETDTQPARSIWQRISAWFFSTLPIEEQL